MTPGGWINLILSVGSVTVLFIWCIWRVLTASDACEDTAGDERPGSKSTDV
jgi:hypothetical protein